MMFDLARFPALARLGSRRRSRVPYVPQYSATECGAACLAMTLAYFGNDVGLDGVRAVVEIGRDGMTAAEILNAARRLGLRGRGLRLELDELLYLEKGSILHWSSGHFVVFERLEADGRVSIVDPACGRCTLSRKSFSMYFSGVALLLEPNADFREQRRVRPLRRHVARLTRETKSVIRLAVLSVMLQLLGLALPAITGTLIDRAIPNADMDALAVLGLGGALAVAFFFVASLLRGAILVGLRTRIDAAMTFEFVERLARAPLPFLQQRGTGDLLQRMNSISSVRDLAADSLFASALDGALVVAYLAVLVATSPSIGLLVLLLGVLESVLFLATRGAQRQLLGEVLATESRASGFQVEMLAGMSTLKAMGLESFAVSKWSNLFVDLLNASLRRGVSEALLDALRSAVRMIGPFLLLGFGAREVIKGRLSLGEMLAANALAAGFLVPLAGLFLAASRVDRIVGHLDRIDDILMAPAEQERDPTVPLPAIKRLSGAIRLSDVSFRYAGSSSFAVQGVSLTVKPGSRVALVGASGGGKSTIAHLLLGLYPPHDGQVLFDDQDIRSIDLESLRRQIGVVPQSPFFFSGTIRENIALGDSAVGLDAVVEAAKLALIHDDIMAMPMGYQTLLLDRANSLAGGQRQRLALARALCRRPSILLLDEATSALDAATEKGLSASLALVGCTRIVIAHRFATIVDSDAIAVVDRGRIVELGSHQELVSLGGPYAALFAAQISPKPHA